MSRAARAASALVLVLLFAGLAPAALASAAHASRRAWTPLATDQVGAELGNGRPLVSFDGRMVRRRVAIAIRSPAGAHRDPLRSLATAAVRRHLRLTEVSSSVLDPVPLQDLAPDLTLLLPPGSTSSDARAVVALASQRSGKVPGVQAYDVVRVLVHDVSFSVSTSAPADLAEAIAREGILSDALGNYTTTAAPDGLTVRYTGPLLSDDLIGSVRRGIARRARVAPVAVTIAPRSRAGRGVDMSKEPVSQVPLDVAAATHHHAAGNASVVPPAGRAGSAGSAGSRAWGDLAAVVAALLILLTLVRLVRNSRDEPVEETESPGASRVSRSRTHRSSARRHSARVGARSAVADRRRGQATARPRTTVGVRPTRLTAATTGSLIAATRSTCSPTCGPNLARTITRSPWTSTVRTSGSPRATSTASQTARLTWPSRSGLQVRSAFSQRTTTTHEEMPVVAAGPRARAAPRPHHPPVRPLSAPSPPSGHAAPSRPNGHAACVLTASWFTTAMMGRSSPQAAYHDDPVIGVSSRRQAPRRDRPGVAAG